MNIYTGCSGVTINYFDDISQIQINPTECLDSNNFDGSVNGVACPKDIKHST